MIANHAVAKYCVKLPTCEELGYIYSSDKYPNNRSIKCPFDTKKILLLDYCQAYGLTSCDSTSGECDECIVEKADGTKSNSGYWRYTRCNAGYSYKSGECPPTEVEREQYPYEGSENLDESIGEIECVQSAQNIYCGYKSCNEGWDKNEGNCIVHQCDATQYPYTSCDPNGTCDECKAGFEKRYSTTTCNTGYYNLNNSCRLPCSNHSECIEGDIYAYNGTPIGVVYYKDNKTTKIVALADVDSTGSPCAECRIHWASSDNKIKVDIPEILTAEDKSIAQTDNNGKYNTQMLMSYIANNNYTFQAAQATQLYSPDICGNSSLCGKGQWYLPSFNELYIIAINYLSINKIIGKANGVEIGYDDYYWSSTEHSTLHISAWAIYRGGNIAWDNKWGIKPVRPVLQICADGYQDAGSGICE